jgi:hypothetical protein
MNKYNLDHLIQNNKQDVMGPIQDDEALFLYSIIKGMRLKTVLEIGFGFGYSATNFLKAVGDDGCVITIDIDNFNTIQKNHIPLVKDVNLVKKEDISIDKIDMVFFDCHIYDGQLNLYNELKNANIITDNTVLALHDTNLWIKDYTNENKRKIEEGVVHQSVERKLVNYFYDLGYSPFCLHTQPEIHNEEFPYRHGVTVMSKFKKLPV